MRGYGLLFLLALASADNGFRSNIDYDDCWSGSLSPQPIPQGRYGSYAQNIPNIRSNHIQVAHRLPSPHNSLNHPIRQPLRSDILPPFGMTYVIANEQFENVYDIVHPLLTSDNLSEGDKTYLTSIYVLHHLTEANHNSKCSLHPTPVDYHAEVKKAIKIAQHTPYEIQQTLAQALVNYVANVAELVKILNSEEVQNYCSDSVQSRFCDGFVDAIIAKKDNPEELMQQVDLIRSIGHSSMKFLQLHEDLEQITSIESAASFLHGHEGSISNLVEIFGDTMKRVYPCLPQRY